MLERRKRLITRCDSGVTSRQDRRVVDRVASQLIFSESNSVVAETSDAFTLSGLCKAQKFKRVDEGAVNGVHASAS